MAVVQVVAGAVAAFQDAAVVVAGALPFVEAVDAAEVAVDDGQHLLEGPVESGSLGVAEEKRL